MRVGIGDAVTSWGCGSRDGCCQTAMRPPKAQAAIRQRSASLERAQIWHPGRPECLMDAQGRHASLPPSRYVKVDPQMRKSTSRTFHAMGRAAAAAGPTRPVWPSGRRSRSVPPWLAVSLGQRQRQTALGSRNAATQHLLEPELYSEWSLRRIERALPDAHRQSDCLPIRCAHHPQHRA